MTVKELAQLYGRSEQTIRRAIRRGAIPHAYYSGGKRGTYIIGERMYYTNDPVADAERYYGDMEKQEEKLPVCCECGYPCRGEVAYLINDLWHCADCMNEYKVYISDYLEELEDFG